MEKTKKSIPSRYYLPQKEGKYPSQCGSPFTVPDASGKARLALLNHFVSNSLSNDSLVISSLMNSSRLLSVNKAKLSSKNSLPVSLQAILVKILEENGRKAVSERVSVSRFIDLTNQLPNTLGENLGLSGRKRLWGLSLISKGSLIGNLGIVIPSTVKVSQLRGLARNVHLLVSQLPLLPMPLNGEEVTNQKLLICEQRLQTALQHAHVSIFQQDTQLRYQWVYNPPPGLLKSGVILGKTDKDIFPMYDAKHLTSIKRRVLQGETIQQEVNLPIHDSHILFNVTFEPLIDIKARKIRGIISTATDITEQKVMQEKLSQSELRFKRLYDSSLIGIIFADSRGNIYEANDAFLKMIGYSRQELTDQTLNLITLTSPEDRPQTRKILKQIRSLEVQVPWDKDYIRKDGSRVTVLVGSALLSGEKGNIISFVLDISHRKELERRKDEFISMASHELKTPITSLKVYGQLLQRLTHKLSDKRAEYFVQKMDNQLNRLTKLVNDLLDVSRIQSGRLRLNLELLIIGDLIKEIVEDVQMTDVRHNIRMQIAKDLPAVIADKYRINQVMTNLLTNAMKYSPEKSPITVTAIPNHKGIEISVKDEGSGIPKDQQLKIFEPFYRVAETKGDFSPGLGLGLHISSEIIKRHGGKIWCTSELGNGSLFSFTLPLLPKNKR